MSTSRMGVKSMRDNTNSMEQFAAGFLLYMVREIKTTDTGSLSSETIDMTAGLVKRIREISTDDTKLAQIESLIPDFVNTIFNEGVFFCTNVAVSAFVKTINAGMGKDG